MTTLVDIWITMVLCFIGLCVVIVACTKVLGDQLDRIARRLEDGDDRR